MKGLFIKDLLAFRKINKFTGMLGTIALLIFLLIMKNEIGFYIANFIILPLNAATHASLLSHYDKQWKWKPYLIAMPVSANDIVLSRMLSSYAIFAIQSICIELFNIIFLFTNKDISRDIFMFVVIAAILLSAICVSISVAVDFALKSDSKLASIMQMLMIIVGAGLVYALSKMPMSIFVFLFSIRRATLLSFMGIVLAGALLISYLLSVKAVPKRE